jgi:hypothetical protein
MNREGHLSFRLNKLQTGEIPGWWEIADDCVGGIQPILYRVHSIFSISQGHAAQNLLTNE